MASSTRSVAAVKLTAAVLLPCLAAVGCGDVIAEVAEVFGDPASGTSPPASVSKCAGSILACGDLVDNDGDGLVDWQDPDCLSACDDKEEIFFAWQPSGDCTLDCFWDDENGSGNDGCSSDQRCDELVAPPYYPPGDCSYDASLAEECAERPPQSQQCKSFCEPLTPNGCDCFGCCTPPDGDSVWLGSMADGKVDSCGSASLYDKHACKPCTPVPSCENTCAHCELCFGKTELPADCGGTVLCQPAAQPCGLASLPPCPDGSHCITGCCKPEPK